MPIFPRFSSKGPFWATLASGVLLSMACTAQTAPDFLLPPEEYGRTVFSRTQTLGGAAAAVSDRKHIFEPISGLREDDPLRRLSRAIGRLDLKVRIEDKLYTSSCTATLLPDKKLLTNHHCIPGRQGEVVEASLVLGYLTADSQVVRLRVAPRPDISRNNLDFAVVSLLDAPPDDIMPARIRSNAPQPLERLTIIHHPAGQAKVMTQFGCKAAPTTGTRGQLRHRCDTLPGSSGAPILDADLQIVGVHHSGGLMPNDPMSFNAGTATPDILAHVPELAAGSPAPLPAAAATGDPDGLNRLILDEINSE